ncbi:MAG: bifunctional glutamate N-acetyltransferase/amino-acid acetyltransferase ArgJ [Candidatus Margulisbacteria bacterium]|nr:bifunctional glutamate N-acetyltransferase/amino-acid acetyltransferase ArgJ [Candidatus Margulisiibacteriota bacterium]
MKKVKGGVCAPKGFKAAGIACGLKKSGKPDLSLIVSDVPAVAVGVFTTNQVKGNPIKVSVKHLKNGKAQAIISNAGNANTWTGKKGEKDAFDMARLTAKALGIKEEDVLVTSTGVIAQAMPMKKVSAGIKKIVSYLSKSGGRAAARAIMTTDLVKKEIAVKVGNITIGAMAKGSGMIEPNMCTMHAFITTDAQIDQRTLKMILKNAVAKSFNQVSVDNCMSTSDCVLVMANGLSGCRVTGYELKTFTKAFEYVCECLAKEMARDGEGASKLMTVNVKGAKTEADAKKIIKALTNSFLLKAAVYGRDKNVGRILQAVGATTAKVNWPKFKFNWKIGAQEDIINVNLAVGKFSATGWGCDLTGGYVKINAKYHT